MTKAKVIIFSELPQILHIPDNKYISDHIDSIKAPIYKTMSALSYNLLEEMTIEVYNTSIKNLIIKENMYGKPYFENTSIHFNISHTENAIACIVSDTNVGIDIEKIKKSSKHIKSYFDNDEIKFINSERDFFKFWTLKEAYVKSIGTGLSYGLKKFKFINTDNDKNILCVDGDTISPCVFYTKSLPEHAISICSNERITDSNIELIYK